MLMYKRGIVEEVNLNPTPKSFIVNQASFLADYKRVVHIELFNDPGQLPLVNYLFPQILERLFTGISLLSSPPPLSFRENTKLPFPED